MEYLYDFGDHWEFDVMLESIESPKLKKPKLIEERGKAPQQYPSWDDDDEWE
jgi:hypothetical protein